MISRTLLATARAAWVVHQVPVLAEQGAATSAVDDDQVGIHRREGGDVPPCHGAGILAGAGMGVQCATAALVRHLHHHVPACLQDLAGQGVHVAENGVHDTPTK